MSLRRPRRTDGTRFEARFYEKCSFLMSNGPGDHRCRRTPPSLFFILAFIHIPVHYCCTVPVKFQLHPMPCSHFIITLHALHSGRVQCSLRDRFSAWYYRRTHCSQPGLQSPHVLDSSELDSRALVPTAILDHGIASRRVKLSRIKSNRVDYRVLRKGYSLLTNSLQL